MLSVMGVLRPQGVLAIPLRVLAATEVRMEPSVRADHLGFTVRVQLRDDHGHPVEGSLRVRANAVRGPAEVIRSTDTNGAAAFDFAIGPETSMVTVRADFSGDSTHAQATVQHVFSLDQEFAEVGLSMPSTLDSEGDPAEAVISVDYSNIVRRTAANLPVILQLDDQEFARGTTDATGRAAVRIDPAALQSVGVHRFRAVAQLGSTQKFSSERRVVIRALTSVVARMTEDERDGKWLTIRGAVAWRGGGVGRAMVTLSSLGRRLVVGQTDERGAFALRLNTESLEPATRARVLFSPTTPWYSAAESEELLLVPPSPRKISWRAVVIPFALTILAISLAKLRANKANDQGSSQVIDDAVTVLHQTTLDGEATTLRVEVYDRSTGLSLDYATITLDGKSVGTARTELTQERSVVKVACRGFASRSIDVVKVRGKSSVLRVGLSNWREYAFGILRPLLPKRGKNSVLSTVEEAVSTVSATSKRDQQVLREGERVVYGPETPTEESVSALTTRTDTERETER